MVPTQNRQIGKMSRTKRSISPIGTVLMVPEPAWFPWTVPMVRPSVRPKEPLPFPKEFPRPTAAVSSPFQSSETGRQMTTTDFPPQGEVRIQSIPTGRGFFPRSGFVSETTFSLYMHSPLIRKKLWLTKVSPGK